MQAAAGDGRMHLVPLWDLESAQVVHQVLPKVGGVRALKVLPEEKPIPPSSLFSKVTPSCYQPSGPTLGWG